MVDTCKDCPVLIRVSGPGIIQVDSNELMKCCKVQKVIELCKNIKIATEVASDSRRTFKI